jgi:hypothetical protein
MHLNQGRADRNVGDDMSMAGLLVHSRTPPETPSLEATDTPLESDCQANYCRKSLGGSYEKDFAP